MNANPTRKLDTIEQFTLTAGGELIPHKATAHASRGLLDYGCRRCWKTMESHKPEGYTRAAFLSVCEIGPRQVLVHRSCCPVCG